MTLADIAVAPDDLLGQRHIQFSWQPGPLKVPLSRELSGDPNAQATSDHYTDTFLQKMRLDFASDRDIRLSETMTGGDRAHHALGRWAHHGNDPPGAGLRGQAGTSSRSCLRLLEVIQGRRGLFFAARQESAPRLAKPSPMTQTLEQYRAATGPLPETIKRWHLHGAGLESLREATVALPAHGPDELLVRHDACGICFSDIKIINLGPQHPRLQGRDMDARPVVMGHEVALTVAGVGENLKGQFEVGQRFIVQADVYYKGANPAYGYHLDGGMAQYGVVTKEVLQGDEGCYLLPLQESTGYVEAALVEPWACVVAAYEYPYRDGLLGGGRLLVVHANPALNGDAAALMVPGHRPASVVTAGDIAGADFAALRQEATGGRGFDDIIVYGTPEPEDLARITACLGPRGVLLLVRDRPLLGTVPVDIGRVHYEQHLFISVDDPAQGRRRLCPQQASGPAAQWQGLAGRGGRPDGADAPPKGRHAGCAPEPDRRQRPARRPPGANPGAVRRLDAGARH